MVNPNVRFRTIASKIQKKQNMEKLKTSIERRKKIEEISKKVGKKKKAPPMPRVKSPAEYRAAIAKGITPAVSQKDRLEKIPLSPKVKQIITKEARQKRMKEILANRNRIKRIKERIRSERPWENVILRPGTSATPALVKEAEKQIAKVGSKAVAEGAKAAVISSAALAGGYAVAAAPAILPVAATAGKASLGVTAAKLGTATAASILAPKIAEVVSTEVTQFTNKDLYTEMKKPIYDKARQYATSKISEKAEKSPSIVDNIVSWLPGVYQFSTAEDYEKHVKQYYIDSGYSKAKAVRIAKAAVSQQKIGGIWDVAGTVGIESTAEVIGSKVVSKLAAKKLAKEGIKGLSKKQAGKFITGPALKGLFVAGFYEGASESAKAELTHKPVEKFDPKNVLIGGGLGSVFAPAIGTPIARWAFTMPKSSKALLTAARIVDPFETPGDIIGGGFTKGVMLPIITPATEIAYSPTAQKGKGKTKKGTKIPKGEKFTRQDSKLLKKMDFHFKKGILTPGEIFNLSVSPTPVPSVSPTPVPAPIPIPDPAEVPPPSEPVPDPDPSDPTPDPDPTETPTDVPTGVPSITATAVPTATPLMRVPPPFLPFPGGGPGSGAGKLGRGKKFKYYDERKAAISAFLGMNPNVPPVIVQKIAKKSKRVKPKIRIAGKGFIKTDKNISLTKKQKEAIIKNYLAGS